MIDAKNQELVSVIVPVYNAEKYIAHTIEMVRQQTYTDWELILVDDCSSDRSVEVIEEAIKNASLSESDSTLNPERHEDDNDENACSSSKIRLVKNPHNMGAAASRNTGIDAARGRYIAFLDADDVWLDTKLEKELAFMKETGAAFVFTSYEFGDEQARPTGKIVHAPDSLDFKHALTRTVIFTTTVLFDMEKLSKDEIHMPLIASEDTATWWKILKTGVVARGLDEVLAIYRRPANSLSSNKFVAMKRVWNLYREIAGLNVLQSAFCFVMWAIRATLRRV